MNENLRNESLENCFRKIKGCTYENTYGLPAKCSSVLLDFSLTVMAATLIFISGCGSAITSAKERKSGFIYNLVKS